MHYLILTEGRRHVSGHHPFRSSMCFHTQTQTEQEERFFFKKKQGALIHHLPFIFSPSAYLA